MPLDYPDPLPFKLRVLRGATDVLKTITVENGYLHDLADAEGQERVFRGRAWFGEGDPIPMLSVLEPPSYPEEDVAPAVGGTTGEYDWDLLVQGFVDDDPVHPTDPAYLLLADVRRRLALEARRKAPGTNMPDPLGLGLAGRNRVLELHVGPGVVRPADDVSAKAWFWLGVRLRVTDNAAEPYG